MNGLNSKYNCLVVLGPTASGKTRLACRLAYELNGEVISADSRQVYKGLDIGTGKDLDEYVVNGKQIPYHLIDLIDPAGQFYLHDFVAALNNVFADITARGRLPVICGGTGLYIDALTKDYSFTQVKENSLLREQLEGFSKEMLLDKIGRYPKELVTHVDLHSKKRIIRGIEIAEHLLKYGPLVAESKPIYQPFYIGTDVPSDERRQRISERLRQRLSSGLIEEVETLLKNGITHERLEKLGLEYKFISEYLQNKISKENMVARLETAIHQFAKRQMTWFRKMEREGIQIKWIKKDADIAALVKELTAVL